MQDINRREFLKAGLGIAAASLLPKALFAAAPEAATGPFVAVARGANSELVKAALGLLGGIGQFVKPGETVCLKPNLSFAANSECGATTSAGVVKQVVQLCLAAGAARVIILDHTIQEAALCVERSGIESAIVDKAKVSLLTLTKERQFAATAIPRGKELKAAGIAKAALKEN